MYAKLFICLICILLVFFLLYTISRPTKVFVPNDIILDNTYTSYPELYLPSDDLFDVATEAKHLGFMDNGDGLKFFRANFKGVWDSHVPKTREAFKNLNVKKAIFHLIPPRTVRSPVQTGLGHSHLMLLTDNTYGDVGIWVEGRVPQEDKDNYYAGTRNLRYMNWITYDSGQNTAVINKGNHNAIFLEISLG